MIFLLLLLFACGTPEEEVKGYGIETVSQEPFKPVQMTRLSRPDYPWNKTSQSGLTKITKEYFRCRGCSTNPARGEHFDCSGRHSLFLKEGSEYIHPTLITLLNYLQEKTKKRVVITSGYRCPEHNTWVDPSFSNSTSRHLTGTAVDFYVEGLDAEKVVPLLTAYYPGEEFKRYTKKDAGTSTAPWYNKEIYIKLCKPKECRDGDNIHGLSYICLQIRAKE